MAKSKYDQERDVLYINEGKSVESIPKGGFILQLNSNREVVGVEILNASEVISGLTDISVEKAIELLENIQSAEKKINQAGSFQMVAVIIKSEMDGEKITQSVSLETPAATA
ncbi:MAG: DUF2283 domain-containing protein [Nanohaloarchaea archaeon]|nr:DUF2283 domain-containing protein [Candidatus Nanohaloarchaea archaeon]